MDNLEKKYKEALEEARNLAHDEPCYKFYGDKKRFKTMYAEEANPVTVFEALNPRYLGATRFYVKQVPTYRDNGNLEKMKHWDEKLMFHKAWARKDIEVKDVKFDIVGIKRQSSKLRAGVLIANVEFII